MKKNLIIILADQLRKDYVGCYGNPYVNTPNLDNLATSGGRFDNCYVNNPISMPNRLSIFRGQYPRNHGMWTNGLMLPGELPTIADTLKKHGYNTCNIGKMHFQPTDCGKETPIVSREDHRYWQEVGDNIDWYGPYWGFDHVELTIGHATRPIAHYGKWFHENGGTDDMAKAKKMEGFKHCPVTTMPEELHDSIFIGERSAEYIKEQSDLDKPFFLVASFPDPHHPFNPPYETALRYKDAPVKLPINEDDTLETRPDHYKHHQMGIWHRAGVHKVIEGMGEEEQKQVEKNISLISEFMDKEILEGLGLLTQGGDKEKADIATISEEERNQRIRNTYAMVDLIDQGIGKIIKALKETGELENTIIVFSADHGELMGDHGLWLKGPFFYDGLVNVPLIISGPGVENISTKALASSIDIYPTCCDLLEIPIPYSCDGISLKPALNGEYPRKECLIEYRNGYFDSDINTMVYIDEKYKFVQYENGAYELTDRINDPEENNNIAENHPELVAKYRERMLMKILKTGSKYPDQISHA